MKTFLFLLLLGLTACSGPAGKSLLDYEKSLCRADSLAQADTANGAHAARLLSELRREYNEVKELSGGKRVRMMPPNVKKQLLWFALAVLLIGLNVWLSVGNIRFMSERKHRRYLIDLSENEQRLLHNERERTELEECLGEMSLTNDEREEVHQSLLNLMAHGNSLHEENNSLRLRLKEYEKRPLPRELELLKAQSERTRLQDERIQTLITTLIDRDELVERLRLRPKFLSDKDWEHLQELADRVYNGFTQRLAERFSQLTPADLQLCLLMCLRFTNAQVATFIAVSPASVSQQKFRLKKRLQQADEELFKNGQTVDMVVWECGNDICKEWGGC